MLCAPSVCWLLLQQEVLLMCMKQQYPDHFHQLTPGSPCEWGVRHSTSSHQSLLRPGHTMAARGQQGYTVFRRVIAHSGKQQSHWCWLYSKEKPLSNFYLIWLFMVGKTKPASVIHHQRERSPEALEDGPPMRSLIRIRLPSTGEDGVHQDETVTTVKCLPNLPSKQKPK